MLNISQFLFDFLSDPSVTISNGRNWLYIYLIAVKFEKCFEWEVSCRSFGLTAQRVNGAVSHLFGVALCLSFEQSIVCRTNAYAYSRKREEEEDVFLNSLFFLFFFSASKCFLSVFSLFTHFKRLAVWIYDRTNGESYRTADDRERQRKSKKKKKERKGRREREKRREREPLVPTEVDGRIIGTDWGPVVHGWVGWQVEQATPSGQGSNQWLPSRPWLWHGGRLGPMEADPSWSHQFGHRFRQPRNPLYGALAVPYALRTVSSRKKLLVQRFDSYLLLFNKQKIHQQTRLYTQNKISCYSTLRFRFEKFEKCFSFPARFLTLISLRRCLTFLHQRCVDLREKKSESI